MTDAVETFDVIALGCGAGNKMVASSLAAGGKRIALVERRYLGGSCPNIACLPAKNLLHTAEMVHGGRVAVRQDLMDRSGQVDMVRVRQRKRDMVAGLVEMYERRFAVTGLDIVWGNGRMLGDRTVVVSTAEGERRLAAPVVVLDTGSRATVPAIPGLEEAQPLTHVEALELDHVPAHLVVLGAGYVGLEFAQAYRRLGSDVTVVGRHPRLLPAEDEDFTDALAAALRDEGVRFVMPAEVDSVGGRSGSAVRLALRGKAGVQTVQGSHLLVAAGRTPNTDGIGLEAAGISLRPNGTIEVDERLRTSVPGIYALGDCAGSPNFTHIAYEEGLMLAAVLRGEDRTTTGRQVPFCLFTSPEYARVGLNETEARAAGQDYRVVRLPMTAIPRAQTLGAERGHLKALVDRHDRILGFGAVGPGVGELLAPIQLAIAMDLPCTVFRSLVLAHPTMSEALKMLFLQNPTDAVHSSQP